METNNVHQESALYLTFKLRDELFALDVRQVREVLDMEKTTAVPNALEFMRGVINVRGSVVPVIDLRTKFGMEQAEQTVNSRIVVMELDLDGEFTVIGALADSVHEVIELAPENIMPAPTFGKRWRTKFIKGIGKRNEQFILLLDVDKIFSMEELATASAEAAAESGSDKVAAG